MDQKQACIDESTDFLCPMCGASAFEVIGTRRNCTDGGAEEVSLVMKCLGCFEMFYHQLSTEEPHPTPAEHAEPVGSPGGPLAHAVSNAIL